jgi:hypothetical protein
MKKSKKENRGGLRLGPDGQPLGGAPLKFPESGKMVKTAITMTPEHFGKTSGNRSGIIKAALDEYFKTRITSVTQLQPIKPD